MINIKDYQDTPLVRGLIDLDNEMDMLGLPNLELNVIGGFAMFMHGLRGLKEKMDIDYVGPSLTPKVSELVDEIALKHHLCCKCVNGEWQKEEDWINNGNLLDGSTLQEYEFSCGELHFVNALEFRNFSVNVIIPEDLLRLKVIAIDTMLSGVAEEKEFTRSKDFADIHLLMDELHIDVDELSSIIPAEFVVNENTFDIIKEYEERGLDAALTLIDRRSQIPEPEFIPEPTKDVTQAWSLLDAFQSGNILDAIEAYRDVKNALRDYDGYDEIGFDGDDA